MYIADRGGNDDLALAKAITSAIQDSSILEKGKMAREYAEKNFTYKNQTEDLIEWLLGKDD